MAGHRDRVYWTDSKTAVREKLGLEDNEDLSKSEVGVTRMHALVIIRSA